jgi:hypothetical protein
MNKTIQFLWAHKLCWPIDSDETKCIPRLPNPINASEGMKCFDQTQPMPPTTQNAFQLCFDQNSTKPPGHKMHLINFEQINPMPERTQNAPQLEQTKPILFKKCFSTLANLTHPMPVSTQNLITCVVQIPRASKDKNAYQRCADNKMWGHKMSQYVFTKPCQQGHILQLNMFEQSIHILRGHKFQLNMCWVNASLVNYPIISCRV